MSCRSTRCRSLSPSLRAPWGPLLVLALSPLTAAAQVEIPDCYVTLLEDVELPAEVAGVVLVLKAQEGNDVEAGELLGNIDDRQARANYKLAKIELQSAEDQAASDVSIRFARAQEAVAKAELQAAEDANQRRPGVIPPAEIRRLELSVTRATLGIEQAQMDKDLLKYTVDANEARLEVAKDEVLRRQIRAPMDGRIVEIRRSKGEWVHPGDPVLRIQRMDQLRVEGYVNINQHSRQQVAGRSVVAKVDLGGGRTATFNGKITFVSPENLAGGDYRVRAQLNNKKEKNGDWLLFPGQKATLIIGELAALG
ncbi:MAG: HlyD family efflux transporter periplasmic adaptor subunit, partial [Planctomycetales bacterium]|nr:HlyD family efflux transporter periplasmic adaptor subunit [Planctomycetales bacterium]